MKKCNGCGAILQNSDPNIEGYQTKESDLCERCFRIKNYNDYKMIFKENASFIDILKNIEEDSLVVLVVDIFSLGRDIKEITKHLKNDILLVFTKRDIIPKSVNDLKLLDYSDVLNINCKDKVIISSNKNYCFDELFEKIKKYKKSNDVYVVGFTNAGKSTMINKLIYNYSNLKADITTSILPSTTLNTIKVPLCDNLTLIDTPGIIEDGNIINYLSPKVIKKIIPKGEVKPFTYQIKSNQFIYVDDLVKIECSNNNLTLFFSNQLKIERFYKDKKKLNLKENIIRVKMGEDIVISGLGFIKVSKGGIVKIYTIDGVSVYTRPSLI